MLRHLIKFALVATCLVWLPFRIAGQNLVPNGSFEVLDASCQFGIGYDGVADWRSLACGATPGYANACNNSLGNGSGVPQGGFGYAPAHTGSAMIALPTVLDSPPEFPLGNPRAYANVPLSTPLVAGGHYCLRLWMNMADSSCYQTDVFHALIGYGLPSLCNQVDTTWSGIATAVWSISAVDTASWMVHELEFTAQGGEDNLTIGSFAFGDEIQATFLADHSSLVGGNVSWYFIDDVELWACQVGVHEATPQVDLRVFPDPADQLLTLTYAGAAARLLLYNAVGHVVTPAGWQATLAGTTTRGLDVSGLANGHYLLCAEAVDGTRTTRRVIVQH